MNDETIKIVRIILNLIISIFMLIDCVLSILLFEQVRHMILSSIILILLAVILILDGILEDKGSMIFHACLMPFGILILFSIY